MKLKYSTIIVDDMDKSVEFYKLLGFNVHQVFNLPNDNKITLMESEGETMIELIDNGDEAGLFSVGMEVEDINKEIEDLKSKGVEFFLGPTKISVGYLAMCKDPNGATIVLIQHTD